MITKKLIGRTIEYYERYKNEKFVISPSLPILYFGDLNAYLQSEYKVLTVGKNPSNNEFKLNDHACYSFFRFPLWDSYKNNLTDVLNNYFKVAPLKQWFSSFEPILNGMECSFYNDKKKNIAIHTDICSPLATFPTWSKLNKNEKEMLFKDGFLIWNELVNNLQPDCMLVSVPKELFSKLQCHNKEILISFTEKKDKSDRKHAYDVCKYDFMLNNGKTVKVIFGNAANKPFDTISIAQKNKIGELCQK